MEVQSPAEIVAAQKVGLFEVTGADDAVSGCDENRRGGPEAFVDLGEPSAIESGFSRRLGELTVPIDFDVAVIPVAWSDQNDNGAYDEGESCALFFIDAERSQGDRVSELHLGTGRALDGGYRIFETRDLVQADLEAPWIATSFSDH